jgi:Domain of unknown function (DUF4359)
MKIIMIIAVCSAAILVGLGEALATTNPSQAEYEQYAMQQLTEYLKERACKKVPSFIQSTLRQLLVQNTHRQDLVIVSLYRTDLKVNPLLPGYKFETIGILNHFYTYTAEQD